MVQRAGIIFLVWRYVFRKQYTQAFQPLEGANGFGFWIAFLGEGVWGLHVVCVGLARFDRPTIGDESRDLLIASIQIPIMNCNPFFVSIGDPAVNSANWSLLFHC